MKPTNKSTTLAVYAVALLLIGLASILYNAKTNQIGLNWDGKSGLIANGVGAALASTFCVFAAKNKLWAHYAGAVLAFAFLIVGFKNGFLAARSASTNSAEAFHWYKAALLGAVAFVSLAVLMPILIYIRRDRPTEE